MELYRAPSKLLQRRQHQEQMNAPPLVAMTSQNHQRIPVLEAPKVQNEFVGRAVIAKPVSAKKVSGSFNIFSFHYAVQILILFFL